MPSVSLRMLGLLLALLVLTVPVRDGFAQRVANGRTFDVRPHPAFPVDLPAVAPYAAEELAYFSVSNALTFVDLGSPVIVDGEDGVLTAVGTFLTAPFDAEIEEVAFTLFDEVLGTGTLRIKLFDAGTVLPTEPTAPALDSLDVPFSQLEAGSGILPLNNRFDVSALDFTMEADGEYFLQLSLHNTSADARLTVLLDGGSDDEDDTDYNPARTFFWFEGGGEASYSTLINPNTGFENPNVLLAVEVEEIIAEPDPTAQLFFLHAAEAAGAVDVYLGGERLINDRAFGTASAGFGEVLAGPQTLDVVPADAEDNAEPLFSTTIDLEENQSYLAIAFGEPGTSLGVAVASFTPPTSREELPLVVLNAIPDVGAIDLRVLDKTSAHAPVETLFDDLPFGELVGPSTVPFGEILNDDGDDGVVNLEVSSADNETVYAVFSTDLGRQSGFGQSTKILVVTGRPGGDPPLTQLLVDLNGNVTRPDVTTATDAAVPAGYALAQNYPNPFNPQTTIAFELGAPGVARLVVYDVLGRHRATLVEGVLPAGRHTVVFDASAHGSLPSGPYVYRLEAGPFRQERLLMLLK